jgi:hypothetical protein
MANPIDVAFSVLKQVGLRDDNWQNEQEMAANKKQQPRICATPGCFNQIPQGKIICPECEERQAQQTAQPQPQPPQGGVDPNMPSTPYG